MISHLKKVFRRQVRQGNAGGVRSAFRQDAAVGNDEPVARIKAAAGGLSLSGAGIKDNAVVAKRAADQLTFEAAVIAGPFLPAVSDGRDRDGAVCQRVNRVPRLEVEKGQIVAVVNLAGQKRRTDSQAGNNRAQVDELEGE